MKNLLEVRINRLYHCCGCGRSAPPLPVGLLFLTWQDMYARAEQLYADVTAGKIPPEDLNEDFVTSYVNTLSKPFKDRINSHFDTPSYKEPNYRFLRQVHGNLFHFAGAKTYHELRELNALFVKNGKIIPFSEFSRKVEYYRQKMMQVREKYRKHWLEAEYTQAIRTAQASDRWMEFEENRDIYPNLIYLTTADERVRDSHRLLHKTVRPIDDPFWDMYYPPNGWRCRCRVEPTRQPVTRGNSKPDIPKMFLNNPAKTGVVFTEKHPFFAGHEDLKKRIRERSGEFAKKVYHARQQKNFSLYRGREDYLPVRFDDQSGGFLVKHKDHRPLSQREGELIKILTDRGEGVILPAGSGNWEIGGARFALQTSPAQKADIRRQITKTAQNARRIVLQLESFNAPAIQEGIMQAFVKSEKKLQGIMLVHGQKHVFIDRANLNRPHALKQIITELQ